MGVTIIVSRTGERNLVLRVLRLFGQRLVSGDQPLAKEPEDSRYEIVAKDARAHVTRYLSSRHVRFSIVCLYSLQISSYGKVARIFSCSFVVSVKYMIPSRVWQDFFILSPSTCL